MDTEPEQDTERDASGPTTGGPAAPATADTAGERAESDGSLPPKATVGHAEAAPAEAQAGARLDATPLAPGEVPLPRAFGSYLLFDRIGRGGMAEIFLARASTELGGGRRLVVKEILPSLSSDPSFSRLLVREAKLAGQLSHRNIVQVSDLGRESHRLFICMEYVEGYDLNQLLRRLSRERLPLPAEFALLIVREVLAALDYAHRATDAGGAPLAIVHRDVSPSNVLVSFDGEVKLCDFGIARAHASVNASTDGDAAKLRRTRVAGKSAYMAPEHARGEEIDARADIFAAGILLWELCAGRRLYRGSEDEMIALARRGDVPGLPDRGLPNQSRLQDILDRALSVDPAARYQSAGEMLEALEEYVFASQLMGSELKLGAFLTTHFAEDIIRLRRDRELAAEAASASPDIHVTEVEPVTTPSEAPSSRHRSAPSTPVPPAQAAPTRPRWALALIAAAVLAATALLLLR